MRRASSNPLTLWQRSLIALTVGLALTFGAVAPHDPASEHDGGMQGVMVDEAARHPEAPPHVEGSEPAFHPRCETCLLQIQTGSRLIAPPVLLPELVRGEVVPAVATAAAPAPSAFLGPARAPPASLSAL